MYLKPLIIGNIAIPNGILLAPMAGITDRSFRLLCRTLGCGLTFSEMISIKSIVYGNANAKLLWESDAQDSPFAVQLFGHEPDIFSEAIKRMEAVPFDIVDINMGCPVPKVVKNGEGSALMTNLPLAGRIIAAAVKASARPVTVKIRKGFTAAQINAVEMAKIAEASGASAIAVHGRTREQYYSGKADWEIIADVKAAVKIPVIGNGDIFTPEDAVSMQSETACDAVMIARGAMGNPWLFEQTVSLLSQGSCEPVPHWKAKIETALEHTRMVIQHKGEPVGLREMRKHLSWYVKGMPGASALRCQINSAITYAALASMLREAVREIT